MDEIRFAVAQLALALEIEGLRRPAAIVMATEEDRKSLIALAAPRLTNRDYSVDGFQIGGVEIVGPQELKRHG